MKQICLLLAFVVTVLTVKSQTAPQGLHVKDKAPLFSATDQNGHVVSLEKLLQQGPVVLVFYRGEWCPYCNRQLAQLQDSVSFIKEKGATLVAVSPEIQENIQKTVAKSKATYPVLSDKGLAIMNSYQVAFSVDSATIKKYKDYGIDFNVANGSNGEKLPVPAVYVINKNGIISFAHFDPDFRKRASVKEILMHL